MTSHLSAHDLRLQFGRTEALRGASIELERGEVVALTGPSGSGKSTLLLCLAGILVPDAGEVWFAGRRLDTLSERERTLVRRRETGVVLQFGQLVPELTAAQNVALPLLLDGRSRSEARRGARDWLERAGADDVADRTPGELSGGEAQRVAVARALVAGPQLVLADEPTGALDSVAGESVLAALLGAVGDSGATLVVVTHDNRVAARADREVVLRDGRDEPSPVPVDGIVS